VSSLFIIYDPEERKFVGVSRGGQMLFGVTDVRISREGFSIRDYEGRELLGSGTVDDTPPETTPDTAQAMADIAEYFGVRTEPDPAGDERS
jgi:hypothetical protein